MKTIAMDLKGMAKVADTEAILMILSLWPLQAMKPALLCLTLNQEIG